MILLTLGQSRPILNAIVAIIIQKWHEGLLEGIYVLYFHMGHALNMSTMRKQAKSSNPEGFVCFPTLDLKN